MGSSTVLKNVVELSMSAVEVSVSTALILSGTREVQSAATSMASAVEELSASIGEIQTSSKHTSCAVEESSTLTKEGMGELKDLSRTITETGSIFESVSSRTSELKSVVDNLSKIVELITKIAGQTNLLALNATIEAARAGEHGKGFAVVAGEVKSLSNETANATKQIQEQIAQLYGTFNDVLSTVSGAQSKVNSVIEKSEKVSKDFEKINENSNSIATQVSELAHIISQQKTAVDLLAQNMSIVVDKGDKNLECVNKLADQSDQSVKIIEDWRAKLANEDIADKVIFLAQADHLIWKKRLLDMAVGRSNLKSCELTDHTVCRLGKWYLQAQGPIRAHPAFALIEEPHKNVHYFGIEAAKCFEKGQIDMGMSHYQKLELASVEVIAALKNLVGADIRRDIARAS